MITLIMHYALESTGVANIIDDDRIERNVRLDYQNYYTVIYLLNYDKESNRTNILFRVNSVYT